MNMIDILEKIRNSDLRVGVIGDAMLDEYFDVKVKKISPEFPIPVMHSDEAEPSLVLPGGAANVAFQLANFNKKTFLCSLLDGHAEAVLSRHGIDTSLSVRIDPCHVPRKRRFYSDGFPTYRWDVERPLYGSEKDTLRSYCAELKRKIDQSEFDVLIFSDYDKGVFFDDIVSELSRTHRCAIRMVDPKNDILKWKGCTLIKPNLSEAKSITGKSKVVDQIEEIMNMTSAGSVVITRGGDGFSGYDGSHFEHDVLQSSDKVNSVIGAGDCFIAFCGLCLGNGVDLRRASEFSFNMGAIYVTDKHNKPLDHQRITTFIDKPRSKIVSPETLAKRDFTLVMTNGCFDLLHAGHLDSLNFAKRHGEKLVVAVNGDDSVSRLKPGRPINKLADRMSMLSNLECVDYVVSFDEDTPLEVIRKIVPDVLVKGFDYDGKEVVGSDIVKSVVLAPMLDGFSTTGILGRI